jgi:hypothetical protein
MAAGKLRWRMDFDRISLFRRLGWQIRAILRAQLAVL